MSNIIKKTIDLIEPSDKTYQEKLYKYHKTLLMPENALSPLLSYVEKLSAIRREIPVRVLKKKAAIIFAADHGVAIEGVSAYPREVTGQMLKSFASGWAVVSVLSKSQKIDVKVVDLGVACDVIEDSCIISKKIARGTKNFVKEPAMSRKQAEKAVEIGICMANNVAEEDYDVAIVGEMGIGNTTSASAIAACMLNQKAARVTGKGTGISEEAYKKKIKIIQEAIIKHKPDINDPLDVLSKLGGFEIGAVCGFILGSAAKRMPIVIDGFIVGSAALLAYALLPASIDYCIAGHCSQEIGHKKILSYLNLSPLLNLKLRLGEGSGAALSLPLLDLAINVSRETATFETACVSNKT